MSREYEKIGWAIKTKASNTWHCWNEGEKSFPQVVGAKWCFICFLGPIWSWLNNLSGLWYKSPISTFWGDSEKGKEKNQQGDSEAPKLRGPGWEGRTSCHRSSRLQGGKTANLYRGNCLQGSDSCFSFSGWVKSQDNPGSEVWLSFLHGCVWLQSTDTHGEEVMPLSPDLCKEWVLPHY